MTTDVEIDEDALFNDAVSDEPSEVPVDESAIQTDPGEPEAKLDAPEKAIDPVDTPDARIPQWRREEIAAEKNRAVDEARQAREQLATERSQREELQRRLNALEKPAAPKTEADEPDPLLDPKGYREFIRNEMREEILNDRREASLQSAHKAYGEEFVEAYTAAQKGVDPALKAKMQASRDPGETLIQWHREQKTMREVGTDPNAWLEKKLEERLSDPAFLAKALERSKAPLAPQSNGRPKIEIPPSLNSVSRSNAALRSEDSVSDQQLFEDIAG